LDGEIGNGSPVRIDKTTGLLATENTPPEMIEERQYFDPHCILYYINPADPLGDAPKDPSRESQFAGWEKAVRDWFEKEKLATSSPYADVLEAPTEYDDAHKPEYAPTLSIESPNNHETITDQLLKVVISAQAPQGIARAEYYINDSLIHVNTRPPFGMEKKLNFLSNGFYNLKVRACDGVFNCTSKDIEFNLKLDNPADIQPISVTITNPSNGLALSSGNFPLPIQVTVNEPKSTARINIYYKKDEGEWQTVGAIQPIDDNNLVYYWSRAPINGTYKLYAEAVSWNEGLSKSNEVMVTITNQ